MSSNKEYKKTDLQEYIKRDFSAEHRVYYANPYNDNIALKRDIAKFLSTPNDKYYKQVTDIIEGHDDETNIKFSF